MSEGPPELKHRPREEIAHDVHELREDIGYEREVLDESIRHDYSTSETGVVPLDRRRPLWHFAGLWVTFACGFSFLFLGFELHAGGHRLADTAGILVIGVSIYIAYALVASYVGSRTGQTHALLTRSIFGIAGSWLISVVLAVAALGWAGFQANLLAQIWNGLYGWGNGALTVLGIGVIVAVVGIFNNLFGFTGISMFARYIVTPLMILWVLYLVIKGLATEGSDVLGATPENENGIGFWAGIGAVVGFSMWGNEQDIYRYGKPRFWWPLPAYAFALSFGLILFGVGGWIMAQLSVGQEFGQSIHTITEYSLFSAFWLAWILAFVGQIAINDGNYYEAINGLQNIIGGWKHWRRPYTCLIIAALGGIAAWQIPQVQNGWFKVAAFLAISVPCASIIMAVDHFVVPRVFRISRPLTRVPAWRDTALINVPAFIAFVVPVVFGSFGSGIIPGQEDLFWFIPTLEAWAMAGVLYFVGVALVRGLRNVRGWLGFSRDLKPEEIMETTVPIDIATIAEGKAPAMGLASPVRAR